MDDNGKPLNFLNKTKDTNQLRKKEDRINLYDNLKNSTFWKKVLENGSIFIMKLETISDIKAKKTVFDRDGRVLVSVIDLKLSDGSLKRSWVDNYSILKDGKLIFRSKNYKFKPIKLENYNKNYKTTALVNPNIGSFDMEVFIRGSESIIYALGFHSYLENEPKVFYINKGLDSNKNVMDCLNEMFKAKYQDITWYCHNSGRYDARVLLKILYQYNGYIKEINKRITDFNKSVKCYNKLVLKHNFLINDKLIKNAETFEFNNKNIMDYNKKVTRFNHKNISSSEYEECMFMILEKDIDQSNLLHINTTFRKSTILRLEITKIIGKTKYKINICDSYAIFPNSLKSLGEKFKVPTLKGDFPTWIF